MTIAGRPMGQDGLRGRAGRAHRSWATHAAAAVVLVVGLGITITLAVVTASGHHRTNAELLALETRLIRDDIAAADPLYVEDHLGGAVSLAAATDGSAAMFARDPGGSVTGKGPHEVALANAGHLPPLVCGGDGASPVEARPGSPIGVPGGAAFEPALLTTAARGTLIAYTDGLVERRGETLDNGLKRLLQAATARCGSSLDDLLPSLVSELTGDSPTDDIALIGLRWLN
jgi:Stage II sporulation protein E (SpoIIE)